MYGVTIEFRARLEIKQYRIMHSRTQNTCLNIYIFCAYTSLVLFTTIFMSSLTFNKIIARHRSCTMIVEFGSFMSARTWLTKPWWIPIIVHRSILSSPFLLKFHNQIVYPYLKKRTKYILGCQLNNTRSEGMSIIIA